MKVQLQSLLAETLIPRGISSKYLTGGVVRDLADRLLLDSDSLNPSLLGVKQTKATEDLKSKNIKKKGMNSGTSGNNNNKHQHQNNIKSKNLGINTNISNNSKSKNK
ncbi:2032_t:CDS:2 [Ambispora gerdemannii]|uniref:2032_t:CDS:1 n=1 Tax=Ambispora gerdemannii TaxID=144530 RepID=A0A9N8YNU7_9GLOM|nr:2032_t:CDS:2 [Ambispora gerdemannii]